MIPQVNAGATDRNREQTKRICELKGYAYYPAHELDVEYRQDTTALAWKGPGDNRRLPNGSLTLCQVVGMLQEYMDAGLVRFEEDFGGKWRIAVFGPCDERGVQEILGEYLSDDPHSLTARMDALIKVLETKGEK